MNPAKLPEGGVLYDENEDDDEEQVAAEPVLERALGIDWNEALKNESGLKGADLIAEFVKHLPNAPGVYRMLNAAGDVMYVGKARSLKKRVSNYAQGRVHSNRLSRMVRETTHMEFVTTRTETEAL
ncbi:MAG TPA: GIY-YIG nuclease family protein, partial [Pseudorhizobium sp.]|nr:GIY-YIG nuclease family protein [Pseudorhizobium sp.]